MATFDINDVARRQQHTSTGGTAFSFSFQVESASDIKVYVEDTLKTLTTHYSVSLNADGTGTVNFGSAVTSGDEVTIIGNKGHARTTAFSTGSAISTTSLNAEFDDILIRQQQILERLNRTIQLSPTTTRTVTGTEFTTSGPLFFPFNETVSDNASKHIQFNSAGTGLELSTFALTGVTASTDELNILDGCTLTTAELNQFDGFTIADEDDMSSNSATKLSTQQSIKAYVDSQVASSDTLAELTDTNISSLSSGHIIIYDGTDTFDNQAISGDATLSASGVLTIANNAVETAMINADAVTGAKIADDAIDSEHYTDGSIDTAHIADLQVTTAKIAADAITGAKIADDAVDSEHYTDGSIDTAHIADSQVTTAKIAADAITSAKIADDAISEEHLDPTVISGLSDATIAGADHLMFFDATDSQLKKVDAAELGVGSALTDIVGDTSPQLGGDLDVNGQDIVSTSNADIDIIPNGTGDINLGADTVQVGDNNADATITTQGTGDLTLNTNNGTNSGSIVIADGANNDITLTPNGSGDVIIDGLKYPQADGTAGQVLKTDGSGQLSFTTPSSNKIVQIVPDSDNLSYTISLTGANNSDGAGSKAYSITPTSSSNKVKIDFFIPQIRLLAAVAGLRMRLYRQIDGGGYSHVTALSGDAASNRRAALAGNYDNQGDGNRSSVWLGGTIVDTPNTTSQVDYKFYFGVGDSGSHTVYVNRTQNDADFNYTHRTRTHCCLSEIDTS